jgi:hypothetical protein
MVCHIFWPKAKRSKATHGERPQEQEPRKLSGVEDLNVQVIRSYSWAATESPKNSQCKPVNNCGGLTFSPITSARYRLDPSPAAISMLFWPRSAPNGWLLQLDGIRHRNSEREELARTSWDQGESLAVMLAKRSCC